MIIKGVKKDKINTLWNNEILTRVTTYITSDTINNKKKEQKTHLTQTQ